MAFVANSLPCSQTHQFLPRRSTWVKRVNLTHSLFLFIIFQFARYYNIREYLLKDFMAGISVGILHIPQGLAFGLLASLKIQDGLFTSIYPVIMYLLFGTSPHISFGTSAVICILVAGTVDR